MDRDIFVWVFLMITTFWNCQLVSSLLKEGECEVCVNFLTKFSDSLTGARSETIVEEKFKEYCLSAHNSKDNKLCYFLGGLETSATSILRKLSRPIANFVPANIVCEQLKKADSEICSLRYDKDIDWKTVNLKKLKVRDLRKILEEWGQSCDNCVEKSEFISKIEAVKHQYVKEEL